MALFFTILQDSYISFGIGEIYFPYINSVLYLVMGIALALFVRFSFRYVFQKTGLDSFLKKLI